MDTNELMQLLIPESVENLGLPDPYLLMYYQDLGDRVIWLDDQVTTSTLLIARLIQKWDREDRALPESGRKPIKLFIASPGGDLNVHNIIRDTIQTATTPIIGIACGQISSAAASIYLACPTRLAFPSASFMLHKGGCQDLSGSYEEIQAFMKDYQESVDLMIEGVVKSTNYSREEAEQKMKGDWYLRIPEALEHGVVHRVISKISEI